MMNKTVSYQCISGGSIGAVETRQGILIGILTDSDDIVGIIQEEDGHLVSLPIENIRVTR